MSLWPRSGYRKEDRRNLDPNLGSPRVLAELQVLQDGPWAMGQASNPHFFERRDNVLGRVIVVNKQAFASWPVL